MLSKLQKVLDSLTRPSGQVYSDKLEFHMIWNKNKIFFIFYLINCIIFPFSIFVFPIPKPLHLLCSITYYVGFVVFLGCYRTRQHIFNTFFTILTALFVPIINELLEDISLVCLAPWLICPLFSFLGTLSAKHFFFTVISQVLYLHHIMINKMIDEMRLKGPEESANALVSSHSCALIIFAGILWGMVKIRSKAHEEASLASSKLREQEMQRMFLLSFSHEFRNLLNSLLRNVQILLLEKHSTQVREKLNSIKICGELVLHLMNNIMDRAKAEIGDLELHAIPVKIRPVIEKIWGVCSELIKERQLYEEISINQSVPSQLRIDPTRITQILLNLVGNAVKFTEKGSIRIILDWISTDEPVCDSSFDPLPFDEDGVFEKDARLKSKCYSYYNIASKGPFIESLQGVQINQTGILKIIIKDTGIGISESTQRQY
jgi:Signal transduction histidine kinase